MPTGYEGRFYQRAITYYEEAGLVYWTMGAPLPETTVINRCRKEDTYEERLKRGALPESRARTRRTWQTPWGTTWHFF